jgi:YjbE family integral membrane protein
LGRGWGPGFLLIFPCGHPGGFLDSVATAHSLSGGFFLSSLGIILINIVLSGDNSVVIAMAVHSLAQDKRRKGIIIGTLGAVILRVAFTWFAARLLNTPFLKLVGGALILWIAVKLLLEAPEADDKAKKPESLWSAVWVILVADFTMSLDNVLAVAGVSKGDMLQIWLSLGLSIPLVIFASTILSKLMDRYPVILYLGAALLGKVGGEMIITDPAVMSWTGFSNIWIFRSWEAFCTAAVLLAAWWIKSKSRAAEPVPPEP